MKCPFCDPKRFEKDLIFKTDHFIFFFSNLPIVPGHALLIPKDHIRDENTIPQKYLIEYWKANQQAYVFITNQYASNPLTFMNPPHQQSVPHLHKHFIPGVFGIHGVDFALRSFLAAKAFITK
jgi:diadenosine tetraphosphate (Ap4A) HIT family hydrolase